MVKKTETDKESQPVKKSSKGVYILVGIIAVVVIVLLIAFLNSSSMTGNVINTNSQDGQNQEVKQNCKDVQVPYDYLEEYQETVPYTDTVCDAKVLIYSRGSFDLVSSVCNQQVEECQKYVLGFCTSKVTYCTDRTITCSLGINNLDDERGVWQVNFNFFKSGSSNVEATASQSRGLDPHSSGTAIGQGKITSKELYDTQYTCSYVIGNEPTKQVCRDVTKYKDVTKTRTVTRYRTENKCE